jgi:hypothetical protein
MAVRGMKADTAPTKHSTRVEWFQRDPGGSTIFVVRRLHPSPSAVSTLEPSTVLTISDSNEPLLLASHIGRSAWDGRDTR